MQHTLLRSGRAPIAEYSHGRIWSNRKPSALEPLRGIREVAEEEKWWGGGRIIVIAPRYRSRYYRTTDFTNLDSMALYIHISIAAYCQECMYIYHKAETPRYAQSWTEQ